MTLHALRVLAVTLVGLSSGNFLFQLASGQRDWEQAVERSWFQVIALLAFAFALSL